MPAAKKPKKTTTTSSKKRTSKTQKPVINEKWSILLFAIGAIFLAMTFVPGESVWKSIRTALFGVFGIGMYFVGPLLIYIAVLVALGRPFWAKLAKAAFLVLFLEGTMLVFSSIEVKDMPIGQIISSSYTQSGSFSGGVLGLIMGGTLLSFCGRPAANIILVILLIVAVMIFTGITPGDIASFFMDKIHNSKKRAEEKEKIAPAPKPVREVKQKQAKSESNIFASKKRADMDINIPLGPEASETVNIIPEEKPIIGSGGTFGMFPPIDTVRANTDAPVSSFVEDESPNERNFFETNNEQEETPQNDNTFNFFPDTPEVISKEPIIEESPFKAVSTAEPDFAIQNLIQKVVGRKEAIITADENDQLKVAPAENGEREGYSYPPLSLFRAQALADETGIEQELTHNAELLVKTLSSFGVETKILDICRGPSVTRYELQPLAGVKISRITGLSDDIALNLATAGVRIEAPIPNKAAVGIEVPNKKSVPVSIRSILESSAFAKSPSPLTIALGKDIAGTCQIADLTKMPHLLIAGSTGSGKSVCINSIIVSILYKSSPEDVKLIMVDPKVVELAEYNGIPHLLMPVVTEPRKAAGALGSAVAEMEKRYQLFAENNVRDIKSFNRLAAESDDLVKLPYIAIIIDELADLMMVAGKEVEDYICRIAQKARAAGMHLIVATQRPSVDVITGLIKANIPSRIAFAVSSQIDSRTILDGGGAEKLLGMGDMLYMPVGASKPVRIQGTYVRDEEISEILNFIKKHGQSDYNELMIEEMEKRAIPEKSRNSESSDGDTVDPMLKTAVEVIIDAGQASTSLLQRKCKLGYARAARIMDEIEAMHIIGPYEGAKPRAVLISRQQWLEMTMNTPEE